MKAVVITLGIVLLAVLLFGVKFVGIHNDLATKSEAINSSWSQIDADLQRRADLIPNLVETVKGYAKEETGVITAISNARAGMMNARSPQEKIDANQKLEGALGRLLVVVENYPESESQSELPKSAV